MVSATSRFYVGIPGRAFVPTRRTVTDRACPRLQRMKALMEPEARNSASSGKEPALAAVMRMTVSTPRSPAWLAARALEIRFWNAAARIDRRRYGVPIATGGLPESTSGGIRLEWDGPCQLTHRPDDRP